MGKHAASEIRLGIEAARRDSKNLAGMKNLDAGVAHLYERVTPIDRAIGLGILHTTRFILWIGSPLWFTAAGRAYRRTRAKLR